MLTRSRIEGSGFIYLDAYNKNLRDPSLQMIPILGPEVYS